MNQSTKYPISKKAYCVDRSKIDEGHLYETMFVHADNVKKAKVMLIGKYNWDITINGNDATYLNIPIKRYPEEDLWIFEGEDKTHNQIMEAIRRKERSELFDEILSNDSITHCYIRKGSYYRPDSCGYTDHRSRAGVYTKEDAISEARGCEHITIHPIDVYEHNDMIQREIDELKTRLI